LQFNPSVGTEAALHSARRFLNYPKHTAPTDMASELIRGWYYRAGSDWVSIEIKGADGDRVWFDAKRDESPDIATHFNDPEAVAQRFSISTHCGASCILVLTSQQGDRLERKLGDLQKGELALGNGTVFIDDVDSVANPAYVETRADRLSERLRVFILSNYQWISLPVMVLGALALIVATLLYWRLALWNTCYVLALVMLVSVLSRAALLILIAATSMAALNYTYISPAYFILIAGCILSIGACLQLHRQNIAARNASLDRAAERGEVTHS
jgi:hypothetical protein